uniref:Uncharacterized protein n=1 Tax=Lotus japonicus TaxID=34305 RepID=I3SAV6_LOTJA|nr:unknown [Lotus japonicus]
MASQTIAVQKDIPTTVRPSEYLKSEKGYAMGSIEKSTRKRVSKLESGSNCLNCRAKNGSFPSSLRFKYNALNINQINRNSP